MNDLVLFILATSTVQWAGSLLMAGVLFSFWLSYRRRYLFHICMSWLALSVVFLGGGIGLWCASQGIPAASPIRLATTAISQFASYIQVTLLLVGTFEIVRRRSVSRNLLIGLIATCAVISLVLTFAYFGVPGEVSQRYFLRFGLRALIVGLAFLGGSIFVFRIRGAPRLGPRLVAAGFVLYGLQHLHYFVLTSRQLLTGLEARYAAYLTFIDFFLLTVIGLGTVVWMLEAERDRLVSANREIDFLSNFDPMTGLPNRKQMLARLELLLDEAHQSRTGIAVVSIAIDGFRSLVDSLGHHAGDEIIRTTATRLGHEVDGLTSLARSGPNEFVFAIRGVTSSSVLTSRLETVLAVIRRPFDVAGHEIYVTASAGATLVFKRRQHAAVALLHAEVALHSKQRSGNDGFVVYSPALSGLSGDRLHFESMLRKAVDHNQFVLHYQPIVDLTSEDLVSCEALIRWRHPVRGLLPPVEFLGIADAIGCLKHIDWWVIEHAVQQLTRWRSTGFRDLSMSINVSPQRIQQQSFVEKMTNIIDASGAPADRIQIEITEGSSLQQSEPTLSILRRLRAIGFKIAIDDFGVGYSSLSNLRNIPVDVLKIDRSFIHVLTRGPRDEAVVSSIITLAHGLDIPVVAEGVESVEERDTLRRFGCEFAQGYLYSRPLPEKDCAAVLIDHSLLNARKSGT